jgi:hypothetical protein
MEHIKGKQDLSQLPDDLGTLLTDIQLAFNQSFAVSRSSMAELGHPLVLHLDYLDSEKESAHAFESGGLHFIGITIPLVERLRDSAERLVTAEKVIALLGLSRNSLQRHNAIGGIFSVKLLFVAAHEFGHHLWGHTSDFRPEQWNNVEGSAGKGSLEQQAEENLADGYAVFLALGSLIGGPQGRQVLEMLGHGATAQPESDTILMSTLLLSAFSFFSGRSHETLDAKSLYTRSHPPAFARVNGIIQTARVWCQRYSPFLDSWLTQGRLEDIMNAEESSRPGSEGLWARQIEFFMSPDGAQYFERLGEQLSRITPPGTL